MGACGSMPTTGPCGASSRFAQVPAIIQQDPTTPCCTTACRGDSVKSGEEKSVGSTSSLRSRGVDRKDTIRSAKFILSNQGKVEEVYTLESTKLGEGAFGSVSRGKHNETKKVRAIKTVSKANVKNIEKFRREIALMKMMDHPNIIKLFETFEDAKSIYLAMELCAGGELFNRIIEAGLMNERDGAAVTQQILRAVGYMHEKQVTHRDLKPENFLFVTKDALENSVLKIIDFGLSCSFAPGQVLSTRVGTPYYVAPQVLEGSYNHLCDMWSVGVIMYILLCGYPPFSGRTDNEVLARVRRGSFSFNPEDWAGVTQDAQDLIRKLLLLDVRRRYTAQKALQHRWVQQTAPQSSAAALRSSTALVRNLRNFRTQNKLKKAALQIIAGQLDDSHLRSLRNTFTALDTNGDGLLSADELRGGLQRAGINAEDMEEIIDGVDTDGSGVIDYTEFLAAALDKRSYLSEQACWTAFKVFDLDGDGRISVEELQVLLEDEDLGMCGSSSDVSEGAERVASLLREVDKDGDGTIDYKEFMAMMGGVAGGVAAKTSRFISLNRRGGA